MTSGKSIPDAQRRRPKLTGVVTSAEVAEALRKRVEKTGEAKSAIVERALRRELGLEDREVES